MKTALRCLLQSGLLAQDASESRHTLLDFAVLVVLVDHHVALIGHGRRRFLLRSASQREKFGRALLRHGPHHNLLARFDGVRCTDPLHGLIGDKLHKVADITFVHLLLLLVWTVLTGDRL